MTHRPRSYPDIVIEYSVTDPDGYEVHTGQFYLPDNDERIAFAIRCNEAVMQGYEVSTWRKGMRPPFLDDGYD